jgi:two-component system, response regulator PdtaR
MFTDDTKLIKRMTPLLQRVLIVDPAPASAKMLGERIRDIALGQVQITDTNARAVISARDMDPQVIFIEQDGGEVDGVAFTKLLRRGGMACRKAPVIMTMTTATAPGIVAARDAGVHEFLRKPYTTRDLLRRLEAVTLRPRDWIEAVGYVGPDRRRFNSGDYAGALKRRSDAATTGAARVLQALRIIKAAVMAVDADPAQVLRSLQTQAADLMKTAPMVGDAVLAAAASDFHAYLVLATERGVISPVEALTKAGPLLALLPKEPAAAPALAKAS